MGKGRTGGCVCSIICIYLLLNLLTDYYNCSKRVEKKPDLTLIFNQMPNHRNQTII